MRGKAASLPSDKAKPYLILLIVLIVIGGAALFLKGPRETMGESAVIGPEGGNITSSDGKLTLAVPVGALDKDRRIGISRISCDELPDALKGLEYKELCYDLKPDGLQFSASATVRLRLSQEEAGELIEDGAIRSLFLLTEEDGKAVPLETTVHVEEGTGEYIAEGTLEHFTPLIGSVDYYISVSPRTIIVLEVGESVEGYVSFKSGKIFSPALGEISKVVIDYGSIEISSSNFFSVTPRGFYIDGPEVAYKESFTVTCEREGGGWMKIYTEHGLFYRTERGKREHMISVVRFIVLIECMKSKDPDTDTAFWVEPSSVVAHVGETLKFNLKINNTNIRSPIYLEGSVLYVLPPLIRTLSPLSLEKVVENPPVLTTINEQMYFKCIRPGWEHIRFTLKAANVPIPGLPSAWDPTLGPSGVDVHLRIVVPVECLEAPPVDLPPEGPLMIKYHPKSFSFKHTLDVDPCPNQIGTLAFVSEDGRNFTWEINENIPWLDITPTKKGSGAGSVELYFNCKVGGPGKVSGSFTLTGRDPTTEQAAKNSPVKITVEGEVKKSKIGWIIITPEEEECLYTGQKTEFAVVAFDELGNEIGPLAVTWSSDMFGVSQVGSILSFAPTTTGSGIITAAYGDLTASIPLTVVELPEAAGDYKVLLGENIGDRYHELHTLSSPVTDAEDNLLYDSLYLSEGGAQAAVRLGRVLAGDLPGMVFEVGDQKYVVTRSEYGVMDVAPATVKTLPASTEFNPDMALSFAPDLKAQYVVGEAGVPRLHLVVEGAYAGFVELALGELPYEVSDSVKELSGALGDRVFWVSSISSGELKLAVAARDDITLLKDGDAGLGAAMVKVNDPEFPHYGLSVWDDELSIAKGGEKFIPGAGRHLLTYSLTGDLELKYVKKPPC